MKELLTHTNTVVDTEQKYEDIDGLQEKVKSATTTLSETLPYFEIAGYRLEKQNHGAPQCSDIALNENKASGSKPQAWSKEINGQEHWLYNFPGIFAEAKFLFPEEIKTIEDLKKKVPEIDVWMKIFASIPGNAEEKAKALNIPLTGFRFAFNNKFYSFGKFADIWSSSLAGIIFARYVFLGSRNTKIGKNWNSRGNGMSLRFLF